MVKVTLFGQMGGNIKDNMLEIKNKDMGNLCGKMEEYIEVNGKMENKKVGVYLLVKMENKGQEYGVMERRLDGFNECFIYFYSK
jgi:hypothetical protein